MDKVLVSACLLGTPCRYDGKSKADARVLALAERYELIPVCPEQLGGLPTPRDPSERQGARVVMASGRDVTKKLSPRRGGGARAVRAKWLQGRYTQGKKPELRLRPCLRRHVFPPPCIRRWCDGGASQGARHQGLW